MNILERANGIVNLNDEEHVRKYGNFIANMERCARIASEMSDKEITTKDAYNVMIAVKLSRQSVNDKEDNLLDAVAYMGSLNNYLERDRVKLRKGHANV